MRDQVANTVGELHYFSFSLNIKINLVVAGGGVVNGFLEAEQGLHDLARQNETDPHADKEGDYGDDAERPLGARDEALGLVVITFDAPPVSRFELGGEVENALAGIVEVDRDLAQGGISFLNGFGDLRVEGVNAIAQLVDQLRAALVRSALEQGVEIVLVGGHDGVDAVGGSLARLAHKRNRSFKALPGLVQRAEGFLREVLIGGIEVADGAQNLLDSAGRLPRGLQRGGHVEEEGNALRAAGAEPLRGGLMCVRVARGRLAGDGRRDRNVPR